MKKPIWKKKRFLIPLIIILLVLLARLVLPYFLVRYVNKTLDNIPGYVGHVEDIDVRLIRGAYVIHGLELEKEGTESPEPLLYFPTSDISIEWSSLLKGRIVSEVELHQPEFNYIFEVQQKETGEEAEVDDWTKALTDLVPIDINHLQVNGGKLSFVQLSANPNIDLMMEQVNLEATNLRNVQQTEQKLPSSINATAVSFGGGDVSLDGRIDIMKKIPDMDMEFALEKANVTALNDMSIEFAGVDFFKGTFELYSELAIADGYLTGYIKPMFINAEILGEEDKGVFENLWEGFVGALKFLFKNQGTDTLATRAPLEGNLNEIDTGVLATILNILKNGWIEAFTTDVDEDVDYQDAVQKK